MRGAASARKRAHKAKNRREAVHILLYCNISRGCFHNVLLARKTGLEPATLGVTGRYSNQLSYFRATNCGVPTGIRTPVIAVKGRCPRPLDDGDVDTANVTFLPYFELVEVCGIEPQTSCMPCKRSPS